MNCLNQTYSQTNIYTQHCGVNTGNPSSDEQVQWTCEPKPSESSTLMTKLRAKKDSETGFSYFGARYYEPEMLNIWLSVDPMANKYPNMSPYNYCAWNPVKLVDTNGMELVDTKYVTEAGTLIVETNDGMNNPFEDVVIIKNEKLEAFTEEVRKQDADNTLDKPSSRPILASFGEKLSYYQSSIIQENDDDYYKAGVRATYQDAYEGRRTWGTIFVFCLGASCESMSEMGTSSAGALASAAMTASSLGKSDREKGRIDWSHT